MSNVDNLVKLIESEVKACRYHYFDLLEVASNQVNGDHLRAYLVKIGYQGSTDEADLVEAAKVICAPTLSANKQLQADILAGNYVFK